MTEQVYCENCGELGNPKRMLTMKVYDHPFDESPRIAYFHKKIPTQYKKHGYNRYYENCKDGFFDNASGDFGYFTCELCQRVVCEQNPSNGWMTQYRMINELQVCLKCYEEEILENGLPREGFEEGRLAGMFFSGDNHEPLDAGYEIDERVHNKLVRDGEEVCKIALEHIDNGHKVIIGYESWQSVAERDI